MRGGPSGGRSLRSRGQRERTMEAMGGAVTVRRPSLRWGRSARILSAGCGGGGDARSGPVGWAARGRHADQRSRVRDRRRGVSGGDRAAGEPADGAGGSPCGCGRRDGGSREPPRDAVAGPIVEAARGKKGRSLVGVAGWMARRYRPVLRRRGRKKTRAPRASWQGEWREGNGFRLYWVG
jgi:hypothetical protein